MKLLSRNHPPQFFKLLGAFNRFNAFFNSAGHYPLSEYKGLKFEEQNKNDCVLNAKNPRTEFG